MSSKELTALKKYINEWLELSRIVPSASPCNYPVLFAEKKHGGGLRLYIDYHSLNVNALTDALPLPHIDDLLTILKGAKVFSNLAIRDGYH